MNENEARALLERALKFAQAEYTELVLSGGSEASTRFANNAITQNIARTDARLMVKAAFGNRVGQVRTNKFDDDSLRNAVRRAEEIARLSEPDTEYMPPIAPREYVTVEEWDEATAAATPEERAAVIRAGIEKVEAAGLNSAGSYATDGGFTAVTNSRGLFACHRATSARYLCTAMTPDSSGWAESSHWAAGKVDGPAAAERAMGKAQAARAPQAVEPKDYTVIMEPAAVAEMLGFLAWTMDAKAADEGRSAFTGRLGERIAGDNITLSSRPDHPGCPGAPFFEDGMPVPAVHWIEKGVVKNLCYSRFWAEKTGREFTGRPTNLLMQGGDSSLEEMIAATGEGILITRFWYIRFVDPMKLLLTGMTRDGLFLVRDGRIVSGIKNMRFNESPLVMLANTVALGKPVYLGGYFNALIPPIKVENFTFSSGTQF
jgi:predicted Zn-dependent protease